MTLDQARYVVEVASCGTLNEAANNLYVSRSAVSQSISSLEHELGFRIFARSRTGSTLTANGAAVYALCVKITQGMDDVLRLAHSSVGWNGPNAIRVGICNFSAPIAPVLMDFIDTHHISVHYCAITDMEYLMNNGYLDVSFCTGVRATLLRHKREFSSQLIGHDDLLLTMRPENPLTAAEGPSMQAKDLSHAKWSFLNPDLDMLLSSCIPNYQVNNIAFVSNRLDNILDAVRSRDLLTLLPPQCIPKDFTSYNLFIGDRRPPRTYNYILYCKGLEDNDSEKNRRIYDFASDVSTRLRNSGGTPFSEKSDEL